MNNIIRFIRDISNQFITKYNVSKQYEFIGRWALPNNRTTDNINIIIDRNNNDHCGTCNSYNIKI